jgi:large subunit ribosomal protein L35Ae
VSEPIHGTIINYRRSTKTRASRECLIQFDHATSISEASQLIGRKVVWKNGTNKFIGKIVGLHGKKGLIRARFRKMVPGQALGTSVELIDTITRVSRVKRKAEKGNGKKEAASPTYPSKLTGIAGIGVKRAEKLKACGVQSIQDLVSCNPKELSEKLQISEKRVAKWINEAKKFIKQSFTSSS